MFKAEVIADSISPRGHRLTTFLITFPRFILAELNTHRMLSRNSASSRAIRLAKMLQAVMDSPMVPMRWMKEHSGMQGTEYFGDETCEEAWLKIDRCFGYEQYKNMKATEYLNKLWLMARDSMISIAEEMGSLGVTKQICNRLLEPFMWHTVLISGTEWGNFFALRAHEAAEIHMEHLAQLMLKAYNSSTPRQLMEGGWHIPFGDSFDSMPSRTEIGAIIYEINNNGLKVSEETIDNALIDAATARCAQTSYTVIGSEGKPSSFESLLRLTYRLKNAGHMSPFEHCARVMNEEEYYSNIRGTMVKDSVPDAEWWYPEEEDSDVFGWCGNYRGFIQYRKMLPGENRTDDRILNKEETVI